MLVFPAPPACLLGKDIGAEAAGILKLGTVVPCRVGEGNPPLEASVLYHIQKQMLHVLSSLILGSPSSRPTAPSLISLQLLSAAVFILIQLQPEHALAFGYLHQPTRRSSQSRRLKPRSYNGNQGRARNANHCQSTISGPPNSGHSQNVVHQIRSSRNCFELFKVVRENPRFFYSEDSNRVLIPKVAELKPKMYARDVTGLLNALARARVPSESQLVHQKLMLALGELASQKIDDFDARGISQVFEVAAEASASATLLDEVAKAAIPTIRTFNSHRLAYNIARIH
eukprot:scaffold4855_cov99-Cylindrotheca_fusiformis.AAC.7